MSRRLRSAGLAALGMLLLAQGCALLPDERKPPVPAQRQLVDQLPNVLAYYREAAEWSGPRLQQEWEAQRSLLITDHCNLARLKLAMLSLHSAEAGKFGVSHRELLKPCLKNESVAAGVQGLALLLGNQITQLATAAAGSRGQAQELEALQQQNLELKRQLEGLKALERSLQQRRR